MDLTLNKPLFASLFVLVATASISACSATSDINSGGQDASVLTPATDASPSASGGDNTPVTETTLPDTTNDTDALDVPDDVSAEPDIGSAQPDEVAQSNNDSNDVVLVENASNVACEAMLDSFRDTMLAMVNHSRQTARQCGTSSAPAVGQVQWNDQLTVAAGNHARDMVSANFFSHTGSDGLGVADRAEAAGYNWRAVGENIAAGQRDIAEVHQGWLDSPGHCRNIMNAIYTEIGAACVTSDATDFGSYWVVVFGDQR